MRWNRYRSPLIVFALTAAGAVLFMAPARGPVPAEAGEQVAPPKSGKAASQRPRPGPPTPPSARRWPTTSPP